MIATDRPQLATWQHVLRAISTVMAVLSPFALYWALTRGDASQGAAFIVVWVLLRSVSSIATVSRKQISAMLPLPVLGLLSALCGVITNEPRFLLLLPSLTQGSFALVFLFSLRRTPLVEHFARMQKPDLPPPQVAYCRTVTLVWGVALLVATLVGIAMAFTVSLATWAVFTGVGSYAVVGALFAVEYVVRKFRFREYGRNPIDQVLKRIFP